MRSHLREAFRELRSAPFTVGAAVITLGTAIGMNVAMVGLVDRALLSPPPHVTHPDRLVSMSFRAPGQTDGQPGMITTSYPDYRALRDHVPAFSGVAAFQPGPSTAVIDGDQLEARTLLISNNYFEVLGARPLLGPGISTRDDATAPGAVVSHEFWLAAFGSDRSVLGRHVKMADVDYTVTGVMPRGFSGHSAVSVDLWVPIAAAMRNRPGWDQIPFQRIVSIVARLADGATARVAADQATAVLGHGVLASGIAGVAVAPTERRIALWLTAVSVLVLLIGLANAATLLLVHAARRQHETAVRAALGASRMRLLSRVFIQAAFIGIAATTVSFLLASWLDEAVRRVLLPAIVESGRLSTRTAVAAALAGLLAILVSGAAGISSLPGAADGLQPRPQQRRARFQKTLLAIQTAICVLLLAGAGMFWRSLRDLLEQDFGMRLDHVLVVDVEPGPQPWPGRHEALMTALPAIRALPGVQAATMIQTLPFGAHHVPPIAIPGRAEPPNVDGQLPFLIAATPDLFDILEIDVTDGRRFTPDDERGEPVVIVNETMAREGWPGERALGRCIRIGFDPDFDPATAPGPPTPSAAVPCRRIVGVARDVRQRSVVPTGSEDHLMQYYVPWTQVPPPPGGLAADTNIAGLVVRTAGDPAALAAPIRRLVVNGRTDVPFVRVRPYADLLARQVQPWRTGMMLLALFSVLAIAVACIGLYAAFAHAVVVRRREMAIRLAIGASATGVVRLVLGEAARLALVGVAAGVIGAVIGGRSLQSMLYGIVPGDPIVLGGTAAAMMVVVLAATWFPAIRASHAEPSALLRTE